MVKVRDCSKYIADIFKNKEYKVYNTEANNKATNPIVVYTLKIVSSESYKKIFELDINVYSDKLKDTLKTSEDISETLNNNILGFYNDKSYRIFDVIVDEDIYIEDRNTNMKNIKAIIHVI